MNSFYDAVGAALGLGWESKDLSFLQMTLRGTIVFVAALTMVRLSDRRALTKKSPFDQILLVVLASVLARAINGSAPLFATIGASAALVFLHRLLALAACKWPPLAILIKGEPQVLVQDGVVRREALRRNNLPLEDVREDLRLTARKEDLAEVKIARLEPSGDISFIMAEEKS